MIIERTKAAAALGLVLAFAAAQLGAQGDMAEVKIELKPVAGHVHALFGRGGNIGVSAGADGVFLVDDQFAPLTDRIRAAVDTISKEPVRFVINTHWHGDHVGGNENLGKAGAVIVAHDTVRKRMSTDQFQAAFNRTVPASPPAALPVVTFNDTVRFHLNGDTIAVMHVPRGHTDGDSIVRFEKANVLHMGDIFFNSGYPFIDRASGGSVQGMLAAVVLGLTLADGKTRIIPGHGELTDRNGLEAYHKMLGTIAGRVETMMREGKSLEAIQAAKPTAEFDARWGGGFISAEKLVAFIHDSLSTR